MFNRKTPGPQKRPLAKLTLEDRHEGEAPGLDQLKGFRQQRISGPQQKKGIWCRHVSDRQGFEFV